MKQSNTKLDDKLSALRIALDYCKLMIDGARIIQNNPKEYFQDKTPYIKVESIDVLKKELNKRIYISCYLFLVSTFENICYKIISENINATRDIINNDNWSKKIKLIHELFKRTDDFYELRKATAFFQNVANDKTITREEISDFHKIISIRNYYAHGEKNRGDMEYNKIKADPDLIFNLNDIAELFEKFLKYFYEGKFEPDIAIN